MSGERGVCPWYVAGRGCGPSGLPLPQHAQQEDYVTTGKYCLYVGTVASGCSGIHVHRTMCTGPCVACRMLHSCSHVENISSGMSGIRGVKQV